MEPYLTNSKEFKEVVHIWDPVFMENVYFFKATNHAEFRKQLKAEFKGEEVDHHFSPVAIAGKSQGGCYQIKDRFSLWSERTISVLSHEVYHLVSFMLEDRRIENHETGAYLMGFFMKEITKYFKFK